MPGMFNIMISLEKIETLLGIFFLRIVNLIQKLSGRLNSFLISSGMKKEFRGNTLNTWLILMGYMKLGLLQHLKA